MTCIHAWVIEPADGPVSEGTCSKCQETREFRNSIGGGDWAADAAAKKAQTEMKQAEKQEKIDRIGMPYL